MAVVFKGHADEIIKQMKTQIDLGMDEIGSAAEQHAKDAAPVRTGALRDSLWHREAGEQSQEIGTNTIDYAVYVELGTWKMRAQPYLRPAGENYRSEYVSILRDALGL